MSSSATFGVSDWESFLREWNESFLRDIAAVDVESFCAAYDNLRDPIARKWLGENGASADHIASHEQRLGTVLPGDYRAFLTTSDGWTAPAFNRGRMLSPVDKIGPFARRFPDIFAVVRELGTLPSSREGVEPIVPSHLPGLVAISDDDNNAILLFDPASNSVPFWHLDFHGPSSPFQTFTDMVRFAKKSSDEGFVEVREFQAFNERRGTRAV